MRGVAVRDDGTILFIADRDGDEFHQLYRIPADGGWPEQLTTLPQVQHDDLGAAHGRPTAGSSRSPPTSGSPTDGEVFIWREGDDEPRYLFGEGKYAFAALLARRIEADRARSSRSNSDFRSISSTSSPATRRRLTPHEEQVKFLPGPWARTAPASTCSRTKGASSWASRSITLETGVREWVAAPDHDVDELSGSADGRVLAWLENNDGFARVRVRDVERGIDLPPPRLPKGTVVDFRLRPVALAGRLEARARLGRARAAAGDLRRRHRDRRRASGHREPRGRTRRARFSATPELIRVSELRRARDPGVAVPAGRRRPVTVRVRSTAARRRRRSPIFRPVLQYLLTRGIGVLATNIRGSTGYGKTYQKLIHHDWGGADLEDWRHAAEWLKAQEFVDADRLGVFGGSYGGFATLTCVTRLPEYWRTAVDIVGPSNLVTFVRAVPPQWLRFMAEWVGDPDTEADFLRERSPITYVDQVRAALHGHPGREGSAGGQVRVGSDGRAVARARSRCRIRRLRRRGPWIHALRERGPRATG